MERGEIEFRKHLVSLLNSGNAHVSIIDAMTDIPKDKLAETQPGLPYSLWQQIEHVRLAQKDIIDYTLNDNYEPMKWPEDYWPESKGPANEKLYEESIKTFQNDLDRMIDHINNPKNDLFESFPYGEGHNLLREALLLADHNAYHSGQIVLLRKIMNCW